MKPVISLFEGGHDSNITVYDPEKDKFYIYELERIANDKGFRLKSPVTKDQRDKYYGAVDFVLKHLKQNYNINNAFEEFHFKTVTFHGSFFDRRLIRHGILKMNRVHHHDAHAWCGYIQAPFDRCAVISWDGQGDDTAFRTSEFDNFKQVNAKNSAFCHSKIYMRTGAACKIFAETEILDVSGKLMGLSAYGEMNQEYYDYFRFRMRSAYTYHKSLLESKKIHAALNDEFWIKPDPIIKDREAYDILYTLQKALEDDIVDWIDKNYIETIREYDGNLILTGGTALNVLANERIKREFPDINVYVPPNCGDGGQSLGMLAFHLTETGVLNKKYNLTFAGPPLLDYTSIPARIQERGARKVTVQEIAQLLKDQKIIGLCQGNLEVGPRALGNRSILCDASNPKMKDILNAKVKFREWFRPFAPICKKEDAHKYFYSSTFDNMECMQFVADVKPEYQQLLPAITHFDNTARLQVVTKESNEKLYNILDAFDGVLINTSFNVQGKPILNSVRDALKVLDQTGLHHVVVEYEGDYWLF